MVKDHKKHKQKTEVGLGKVRVGQSRLEYEYKGKWLILGTFHTSEIKAASEALTHLFGSHVKQRIVPLLGDVR